MPLKCLSLSRALELRKLTFSVALTIKVQKWTRQRYLSISSLLFLLSTHMILIFGGLCKLVWGSKLKMCPTPVDRSSTISIWIHKIVLTQLVELNFMAIHRITRPRDWEITHLELPRQQRKILWHSDQFLTRVSLVLDQLSGKLPSSSNPPWLTILTSKIIRWRELYTQNNLENRRGPSSNWKGSRPSRKLKNLSAATAPKIQYVDK